MSSAGSGVATSLLALALVAIPATARPARADDVTGFYRLVSIDNTRPDGSVVPQYGPNPKGSLSLDRSGRYLLFIRRAELPKFATPNTREGTPQENKAVIRGSIAHTGTYIVNEADKSITFRIETSTFPNQDGTEQKRPFTLTGNELKYIVATPSVGSGVATLVWRRVRAD